MANKNPIEDEVDAIRDRLCAATQNMSIAEETSYFRALAEKTRRDFSCLKNVKRVVARGGAVFAG
ncbi:MAG: hypothetical protein LBP75_03725 [Planctomycetota bacterium]|jgi:hypothetical protein|nr:hypothetical protein [Planctomycetota bacterium]